jgi:tRNA pseudouridine38-40 synthase
VLEVVVAGESFLRHMVRGMVGTLVDVGRGHMAVAEVASALASRDRAQAGPNLPPQGLVFEDARY